MQSAEQPSNLGDQVIEIDEECEGPGLHAFLRAPLV
jgi:hypothetical protein